MKRDKFQYPTLITIIGIVLCPLFFETFRKFEDVEASKYLLGPYFEFGYKSTIGEPTFFSAKILLHGECLFLDESSIINSD